MSLLLDTNVLLQLVIDSRDISEDISEPFKEEVESGLAHAALRCPR